MNFLGERVHLTPKPAQTKNSVLEAAMLGHCPGKVRIERLLNRSGVEQEIRMAGFGKRLDDCIADNTHLNHLPIPLRSQAEFEDIFPQAKTIETRYRSQLAGATAWLPVAVEDFFANGGEKLWMVQIPEEAGLNGFLPERKPTIYDTDTLYGLYTLMVLSGVGLIAMPDLERIQLAQNLPDIPRLRLANPQPAFIPCTSAIGDNHRERRHSEELMDSQPPQSLIHVLQQILTAINEYRPDMQCLYTMPLDYSETSGSPEISQQAVTLLEQASGQSGAHLLRQAQLLFPYLRNSKYSLYSPTGVVAGTICRSALKRGIWRSIAEHPFITDGTPYPAVSQQQKPMLREKPGIGILYQNNGKVTLDDERITVPALHKDDYRPNDSRPRIKSLRSAEVVRFIGYLKRQLKTMGETLIFDIDYRDPRPRLLLDNFFVRLHERGALRGNRPQDGYKIHQYYPQEGVIAIDIEIAPAYPIDKLVLTFVNRNGDWYTEASHA